MPRLSETIERKVSFHDLDAMGVVWHGHYLLYMEEAREAFLNKYGTGYMQMLDAGYFEPITHLNLNYKGSFVYGDQMRIEIEYEPSYKACIIFKYRFFRVSDGKLMTEATTTQHFVTKERRELELLRPDFYREWQKKWHVFDDE